MQSLQNIDSNGFIDKAYYKNTIEETCERFLSETYPDIKITNNHLIPAMTYIYNSIFKPDKTVFCNNKCNIPYNEYNIKTLLELFLDLYNKYLCIPSLYTFSLMTGITEETIQNYVTDARIAITNNRREKVQGKLYNSPLGVTVLANNDIDTGLLYNRQNIIDHESVKQGISFNDLCKLTEKTNE